MAHVCISTQWLQLESSLPTCVQLLQNYSYCRPFFDSLGTRLIWYVLRMSLTYEYQCHSKQRTSLCSYHKVQFSLDLLLLSPTEVSTLVISTVYENAAGHFVLRLHICCKKESHMCVTVV